jgi:predicted ABC-type ATPase
MTSFSTANVCDFDQIYSTDYSYSLPKPVLEKMLNGTAFGEKDPYSPEKVARITEDTNRIYANFLSLEDSLSPKSSDSSPVAVLSAGAPGAGKTTLLRQLMDLKRNHNQGSFAYICPDDVCLKNLTDYKEDIAESDPVAAYDKNRSASNAAAHFILANLIREKHDLYFGTTSSGPSTHFFYGFLKAQGYRIEVIYVNAPDEERWNSIQERDKTFVQTTQEDIVEKGKLIHERMTDTFLRYADVISLYHREKFDEDAQLAATWTRTPDSETTGALHITDPSKYANLKELHNTAIESLGKLEDFSWEATIENPETSTITSGSI